MALRLVASSDERAMAIRDHALPLLRARGSLEMQRDAVRVVGGGHRVQDAQQRLALHAGGAVRGGLEHAAAFVDRQRPVLAAGVVGVQLVA